MNKAIKPGQIWLDDKGARIQAHGATVFFEKGTYYWIGENKEYTDGKNGIWTYGIKCYSSKDLYNWHDEGFIVNPEPDDNNSPFHPRRRMDRPHLIYCEHTKKYVLWLKYCDGAHYEILQREVSREAERGNFGVSRRGFSSVGARNLR